MIRFGIISTLAAGVILAGAGLTEASNVPVPPRVVTASSASGDAVFTIADMSPDTGVYAVQWVTQGDDFNSYQMMRATSKTITVPYLSCTRSYTLRVFVMAATWRLADGHQTQNVTAHSPTFDLTMPACKNVTSSDGVTSLSCAQGGVCAVGDTGPGGGIVFYVAGANFTSTGSDCGTSCRYLEVAPDASEVVRTWATNVNSNRTTAVAGADATAIGSGYQNTVDVNNQAGNVAVSSAAVYAFEYTNNGKSDWHLPSKDELNELCKYATTQTTGDTSVACTGSDTTGTTRAGFSTFSYWSSSEFASNAALPQMFANGLQNASLKSGNNRSRPVRAFG